MGVYELSQTTGICTLKDTKKTDNPGYAYLHSAASQGDKKLKGAWLSRHAPFFPTCGESK